MHTNFSAQGRKIFWGYMLGGILLILFAIGIGPTIAHAQDGGTPQSAELYTVNALISSDSMVLKSHLVNGPSTPPPGFEAERQPVALPKSNGTTTKTLPGVGTTAWVDGCSATGAADIAAFYDRGGYPDSIPNFASVDLQSYMQGLVVGFMLPNLYTGPTNGGVMPTDNSAWGTWIDIAGDTYTNNPLVASHKDVDGRTIRGTIDDYWVSYGSTAPDPYITGGWTQHTWGDAIGDYMYTSQSVTSHPAYSNPDGGTRFFFPDPPSASRATCDQMASQQLPDGTLGRKRFYEARGYTVAECYNQLTDHVVAGGFSFAQFMAEIDAGRPVLLGMEGVINGELVGHNIVGIGYSAPSTIYLHDTWDFDPHTMTWGGTYAGLAIHDVSIVNLVKPSSGNRAVSDFNGDGITDVAVFRRSNGVWYVKDQFGVQFGANGDIPIPGDYNGDGITDVAVFRPSNGVWYVRNQFGVQFGANGDTPIPGDYNGDGITDVAVFRPSNGVWYVRNQFGVQFGANGDIPIPGDYNGDGITDVAVFRPSNGVWYVRNQFGVQFGANGDIPIPRDYNGDGITDVAVFRPSSGVWYVRNQFGVQFGANGDIPIPGDYNGDGITDVAVFRPSNGVWYVRNQFGVQFGANGDIPIPSRP